MTIRLFLITRKHWINQLRSGTRPECLAHIMPWERHLRPRANTQSRWTHTKRDWTLTKKKKDRNQLPSLMEISAMYMKEWVAIPKHLKILTGSWLFTGPNRKSKTGHHGANGCWVGLFFTQEMLIAASIMPIIVYCLRGGQITGNTCGKEPER